MLCVSFRQRLSVLMFSGVNSRAPNEMTFVIGGRLTTLVLQRPAEGTGGAAADPA